MFLSLCLAFLVVRSAAGFRPVKKDMPLDGWAAMVILKYKRLLLDGMKSENRIYHKNIDMLEKTKNQWHKKY